MTSFHPFASGSCPGRAPAAPSRRGFLAGSSAGFGMLALSGLLEPMAAAARKTNADTAATDEAAASAAFEPPPVASALLVVAPGDSIAPAVLLSVGTVAQVSPAGSRLD